MKIVSLKYMGFLFLAPIIMSGCASTLSDHSEKYKDLNLKNLLDPENVSADHKQLLQVSLVQRGEEDNKAGHSSSAVKHAEMALKFAPESQEAKLILAEARLNQGRFEDSENIFSNLLTDVPSAVIHQGYGLSLLGQNKTEQAQTWLNKAVMSDPDLWRAWNGLGIIYDRSKDWDLSEKAYKAALQASAHNAAVYSNLGLSYMQQDRLTEAVTVFENAFAVSDETPHLHYRTALALSGNLDKAKEGASDSEIAQLYNNLGTKAMDDGEHEKAITYLKTAIAKNPSHYAKAIENLDRAQSLLP